MPPLFQLDSKGFSQAKQLFEKIAEEASLSMAYHKQILQYGIIELLYRINRLDKPCLKKRGERDFKRIGSMRSLRIW